MEERPLHVIVHHYELPFVPAWALQLIAIGAETRAFPVMFEKIAQLLEYQRRYYLLKQGQ